MRTSITYQSLINKINILCEYDIAANLIKRAWVLVKTEGSCALDFLRGLSAHIMLHCQQR